MRRDSLLKYGVLIAAFVCLAIFLQPHSTSQIQADGSTNFAWELGLPVSPWLRHEYVATPDGTRTSLPWQILYPAWSWPFGIIGLSLFYGYWGLCRGWLAGAHKEHPGYPGWHG